MEVTCQPLGRHDSMTRLQEQRAPATRCCPPRGALEPKSRSSPWQVTPALALGCGQGAAELAPAHQGGFGAFSLRDGIQGRALSPGFHSAWQAEGRSWRELPMPERGLQRRASKDGPCPSWKQVL